MPETQARRQANPAGAQSDDKMDVAQSSRSGCLDVMNTALRIVRCGELRLARDTSVPLSWLNGSY